MLAGVGRAGGDLVGEGLFHDLVERIVVESQTCVRFRLQGGIELKEPVKEAGR